MTHQNSCKKRKNLNIKKPIALNRKIIKKTNFKSSFKV